MVVSCIKSSNVDNMSLSANRTSGPTNPSAGEKIRMTCAQAVIEFFRNQHVEQLDGSFAPMVYGYWGIFGHGNVCGLGEALEEGSSSSRLKYFRGQNEQGTTSYLSKIYLCTLNS